MKKDKYLSKEYTSCLRGIFAIMVVLHHLYQGSRLFNGTYIGSFLSLGGPLAVSVFFFYSGYGLVLSSGKKNYIQNFFRNRFLPLYCFYGILIILYSFWTLLLDKSILPQQIVQSFFFGKTIVTNGWYLQTTFVLYLIYWFSFSVFKSTKTQIFAVAVAVFAYCVFCRFIGLDVWWYQTIPCVVLGMVYCYKKAQIDVLLNKYAVVIFIVSLALFAMFYIISHYFGYVIFRMVCYLFFVFATIAFSYILCATPIIDNSFFALCGKYSLEIYVSHGFFLRLMRLKIINNKFVYILTVIVGTIIMSLIMKLIHTRIITLFDRNKCRISD